MDGWNGVSGSEGGCDLFGWLAGLFLWGEGVGQS